MNLDGANETDVREEVATPFLRLLGYQRGTENDILREFSLSYDRTFLGRYKPNDPPLRGRADYVLSVKGAARWVIEVKAPSEEITDETVNQAISYAKHPEVAGYYIAVLNGKRFVLYDYTQTSNDEPIVDIVIETAEVLAETLRPVLSPASIRRDCRPAIVDLETPLAEGFRSTANIVGGSLAITNCSWNANFPVPVEQRASLEEMSRRLTNMRTPIIGGSVWRDEASRIRAKLAWDAPHDALLDFAFNKKLMDAEYISLHETVSTDPDLPTCFDVVGTLNVKEGEELFDIVRWNTVQAGIEVSVNYNGAAQGFINENVFQGKYGYEQEMSFPLMPAFTINVYTEGVFEIILDSS